MDEVLRSPKLARAIERDGRAATSDAVRAVIERIRREIASGDLDEAGAQLAMEGIYDAVDRELRRLLGYSLQRVINATGVILHTNLGRAPISRAALEHLSEVAGSYSNLEFDLETGERGRRDIHAQRLLEKILGSYTSEEEKAPRTIVVNNCAAAVLLALNTLADGGDVIVSRGELVEIGGSFRVPEIMAKSGAQLREVGSTNRTRLSDYEKAIGPNTRLLLRVHRSNFAMIGFTEQPKIEELVELGRKHHIPVMEDLGNGLLLNLAGAGIQGEHGLNDSLAVGVDVVCVSGDKLLGGPQAGIIAGREELVKRMRLNPLFRALRVDKLTYAALEATLLAYVRQEYESIPILRMIHTTAEEVGQRSESLIGELGSIPRTHIEIIEARSVIGGGAAPNVTLPTFVLAISADGYSAQEIQDRLRAQSPAIVARIEEERLVLDLRTVAAEEETLVLHGIRAALS